MCRVTQGGVFDVRYCKENHISGNRSCAFRIASERNSATKLAVARHKQCSLQRSVRLSEVDDADRLLYYNVPTVTDHRGDATCTAVVCDGDSADKHGPHQR